MKLCNAVSPGQLGCYAVTTLFVCAPISVSAQIQSGETVSIGSPWTFTAAPYLWATGLEGSVGVFGFPAQPVDLEFGDVLENLDVGFMAVMEARNGPYVLGVDVTYARLSQPIDTPVGVAANSAEATVRNTMVTLVGGYDVAPGAAADLDLVAGIRYWSVDNELSFTGGALDGVAANDGDSWADPVIGAKFRASLGENWDLAGWALVGGFGVASEEMWDIMAGAGYAVRENISLFAGYRIVGVEYSQDGFTFDVTQSGPVFGGVFRF